MGESEYDDAGGCFITHSLRFFRPCVAAHVRIPDELWSAEGTFDAAAAAEALAAEHADDACDFAAPFMLPHVADATTLHLSREALAPLVERGSAVSGLVVARLLWPDHEVVKRIAARSTT